MTETNMILSNPYRGERRPGTVGLPLPGVEVRAVQEPGAEASSTSGGADPLCWAPGPGELCYALLVCC